MKDYSHNYEEYTKFILSYKIENNKIIVKLANGDLYTIPYTEENEQKIISRMEAQARFATIKPTGVFNIFFAVTYPLIWLPIAIINYINLGGLDYGFVLAMNSTCTILFSTKVISNLKRNHDIKKMQYFLANKQELNEALINNDNIKIGLSNKAIKQIELQKSTNQEPFNINNLDNYSLSDLKTIKENIARISAFNFDETAPLLEEPSPVLKRTLKNKTK